MDAVLFIMVLILPVAVLSMGLLFKYKPPRKINMLYGFRTQRSMASQEAWDAAHRMGGQIWSVIGIVLVVLSVAVMLIFSAEMTTVTFAVYGASFVGILVPLGIIQNKLKKMFGK
jgi:uncharacterized membrane protein